MKSQNGTTDASEIPSVDAHGIWLQRIALSVLDIERPRTEEKVAKTKKFQKDVERAVEAHLLLMKHLVPHLGGAGGPDPIAIAGAWSGRKDGLAVSVMKLPSMERLPLAEEALQVLGQLFDNGLSGIYVQGGPAYTDIKVVWVDDDNHPTDITDRDDMLALLLYLRADKVLDERYYEVIASLREGRTPAPPAA